VSIDRAKFIRFALVGGCNAVIYAVATAVYFETGYFGEKLASALGFLTAVPFAFFAHRFFTFASRGAIGGEWLRFVVAQFASMGTSLGAMWLAVDVLGWHLAYGIFAGIVLVPIMTFLVLNRLVFKHQSSKLGQVRERHP